MRRNSEEEISWIGEKKWNDGFEPKNVVPPSRSNPAADASSNHSLVLLRQTTKKHALKVRREMSLEIHAPTRRFEKLSNPKIVLGKNIKIA